MIITSRANKKIETYLFKAIEIDEATKGNIQLYNKIEETLTIISQTGFSKEFLEYFKVVKAFDTSACGRAIGIGSPVVIGDVNLDIGFAPHLKIARVEGFRAVKSVPLISSNNNFVGVLSTHFEKVQWSWDIRKLNNLVNEMANFIEAEVLQSKQA